jgi:hypothetical protein
MPTSKSGSDEAGRALSASDRTVGLIFAAQPQVRESPVRVFFLPNSIFVPLTDAAVSAMKQSPFIFEVMYWLKVNSRDYIVNPDGGVRRTMMVTGVD